MTFLKINDLQVEFRVDKKMIKPIEGVSFQMQKGEVLGMVGETGSGKSLTAHAIVGLSTLAGGVIGGVSNLRAGIFCLSPKKRCSQSGGGK